MVYSMSISQTKGKIMATTMNYGIITINNRDFAFIVGDRNPEFHRGHILILLTGVVAKDSHRFVHQDDPTIRWSETLAEV